MKKFISFALAASMALSMIPATAFASSDLTTSHSNIRVTANTEFKPKKDAGSDYRDVPYILLEASNDFIDDKQTFELALENAEWLEMDGDDGDTLYVEDDATMKDYLQFVPANGSTGDSPSGTTPSESEATLQKAYYAAAETLKEAADNFLTGIGTSASTEKTALDAAIADLDSKKEALVTAQGNLKTAQDNLANVEKLVDAYTKAYADTQTDAYKKAKAEIAEDSAGDANGVSATEAQKELVSAVDAALASAADALTGAGAEVLDDLVNTEGIESAVSTAEAAVSTAERAVTSSEAALSAAQKAYDDKVASLAGEAKTALDAALKARNEAGQKLVDGYGDSGVKYIRQTDEELHFCDSNGDYTQGQDANQATANYEAIGIKAFKISGVVAGVYTTTVNGTELKVTIDKKSDTRVIVTTEGYKFKDGDVLRIPLFVRTTGGVASVSIDSLNSEFTSEGKTFAKTADGDTNLTIEKTQSFYDGDEVKNIYIEELVPGTLEDDGLVSLRVNGDFKLKRGNNFSIKRITGNNLDQDLTESVYTDPKCEDKFTKGDDSDEIYIQLGGTQSTQAVQYRITGLLIVEDGADFGDEATITVSGGGTSKQTVTIGTYEDYGVKMTAEDKELPVIYAGTKASSKYDNQTLKVTIEETVANSFIDNRKMELTLPEGVEFVRDDGDAEQKIGSIDDVTEDFKAYNFKGSLKDVKDAFTVDADGGKITITSKDLPEGIFESSGSNKDRKRKFEFSVHVSAEADFTGDVVMTLSGPAVANQSVSATIATVKAPIEVRTTVNELKIDYRNTDVADITIVEPEAGLWAKDDVIRLEGERMSFEGGAKAEVVNGDMKLAKLGGDYVDTEDSGDDKNGVLFVKVDSRSSKTPAEIKISGLSLYMNRSLAAGDYKLKVFGDEDNEFFMNNYHKDGDDYANSFETAKVTVMNDFVKVVTAGRDKDDATFTTSIVVPVGSDVITAGTREIKLSEMEGGACPPAYINNDGYTMLPVRAVTESLNNIAAVRWDDATKTCTIGFGQRVFSMTVGSKVLNMNGVSTALNAAPEIRDGRVFLPLRDLGYALGLSESQISWDATTQTARLN